jgi:hypothetical protein
MSGFARMKESLSLPQKGLLRIEKFSWRRFFQRKLKLGRKIELAGAVELAMGGSELWANANQSRRAPFRWLLISDR